MKKNAKYISPEVIFNRLTKIIKGKSFEIGDVISWCAQVETEFLGDDYQLIKHEDKPFKIDKEKRVRVPNNLYRLFSVTNKSGTRLTYEYNGAYIFLPDSYTAKEVHLNYTAIPIDPDTGYPLILRGHEPVCEAYCLRSMYYENYLNGEINQYQWNELVRSFEDKLAGAATGVRYMDADEKEAITKVMYSIIKPFNYPNSF
jgi:hypothetical protein